MRVIPNLKMQESSLRMAVDKAQRSCATTFRSERTYCRRSFRQRRRWKIDRLRNLAVALAMRGLKVGLLDADVTSKSTADARR